MLIDVDPSALKQTRLQECALRFLIGGGITLAAGLIAKSFGPEIGGLFLAFPAIFPASATLVAKHEEERKARAGLHGHQRAIGAAAVNAAGTTLGSIGLAGFAITSWALFARHLTSLAFCVSIAIWFLSASLAWFCWKRNPKLRH
jgi:hypothetical protein